MRCAICRNGDVRPANVETEIKIGPDRVLVTVDAERCTECGEAYFGEAAMRSIERMREEFGRHAPASPPVGSVYRVTPASRP